MLVLTLKPNLFSASTPTSGAAHAATAPSKHRSKAKTRLRMWAGTMSAKAGLLQAGPAQLPRLFIATRAHAYKTTLPGLPFSGRPCRPNSPCVLQETYASLPLISTNVSCTEASRMTEGPRTTGNAVDHTMVDGPANLKARWSQFHRGFVGQG